MNNILLFFFEDGSRSAISFPRGTALDKALEQSQGSISRRQIKKYFYIQESRVGAQAYQQYATLTDSGEMEMNHKRYLIEQYLNYFRDTRNNIIKQLDIPFMRALEDDCEECKNHIIQIKRHLRQVPEMAWKHMNSMSPEKIIKYNPFCNIYGVALVRPGSGYKNAPEVKIEPPRGKYEGVEAKAVAMLDGDKLAKIEIVDPGSGYTERPSVIISAPEEGEGAIAVCFPPENNFIPINERETLKIRHTNPKK